MGPDYPSAVDTTIRFENSKFMLGKNLRPLSETNVLQQGQIIGIPKTGKATANWQKVYQSAQTLRARMIAKEQILKAASTESHQGKVKGGAKATVAKEIPVLAEAIYEKFTTALMLRLGLKITTDLRELTLARELGLVAEKDIRAAAIEIGREVMMKVVLKDVIQPIDFQMKAEALLGVFQQYPVKTIDDLLVAVGMGRISIETLREWQSHKGFTAQWMLVNERKVLVVRGSHNRPGIAMAVTGVLGRFGVNIVEMRISTDEGFTGTFTVDPSTDLDKVSAITENIMRLYFNHRNTHDIFGDGTDFIQIC